jgi:hypothetical protein
MIYLIFTASLSNHHGESNLIQRREEYIASITETLRHLPSCIQPIIVENNGQRETCLDHFVHFGKPIVVHYTNHNQQHYASKGVNELMDLQAVLHAFSIQPTDMIIKLTGRYHITSPAFFDDVIAHEKTYDAFVKFFNVCTLNFEPYDCVLGCYAIRALSLLLWNPGNILNYPSAEIAFARYVRSSVSRIKEMDHLSLRCIFADDLRILDV